MSIVIGDGMVVGYHFKMFRKDNNELLGANGDDEPAFYLHGHANVPPGLEQGMAGKKAGDSFELEVAAEGAFGERQEVDPIVVPVEQFSGEGAVVVGASVVAEGPDGEEHLLFVTAVSDEEVSLDPNHPLAGVAMRFAIEVVSVREATADEKAHGHPHEGGAHGDGH